MSRIFIDTNFLIYVSDDGDSTKRDHAKMLWKQLSLTDPDSPVISTQVLQEYYNGLTKKLKISPANAKEKLELLASVETLTITPSIVLAAADLHAAHSISFWDALIIAAAQYANCDELWTEDLQDGRSFGSLKVRNPFVGMS